MRPAGDIEAATRPDALADGADRSPPAFDRALIRVLTRLAQTEPETADEEIESALAEVGRAAGFDRTYVFRFRDATLMDNSHEWAAQGVEPMKSRLQGLPIALIDHWRSAFDAGAPVHIPDVPGLSPDRPERDILMEQDIRSILAVPMMKAGRLVGFVGYDAVREARPLLDDDVFLLESLSAAIAALLIRRRDALALREGKHRMAAVLDALPDLVMETNAEGRYIDWHGSDLDWLAIPPDELVGKTPEEALPPEAADSVRVAMVEADKEGRSRVHRYMVGPEARPLWREFRVARKQDGGRLVAVRDATARVEAEQALRAREALLDAVFAEAPVGMVLSELVSGVVLDTNAAYLASSGYDVRALAALRLGDLVAPKDRPGVADLFRETLDTGRYGPIRVELSRADGGSFPAVARGVASTDAEGKMLVWSFVEDLTEHVAHQAELRARSEESDAMRARLEAAIDALPDGFSYYDAEDRLVLCNRRYRDYYPRSAYAMTPGARFEDIIRAGLARGEYEAALGREEAFLTWRMAEHRRRRADFEQTLADGRCLRVIERRTPEGGHVGLRIDITQQKETERRLQHVIDGARVGTWEWDIETGANIVNARWAEMLGRRLEDLGLVTIRVWEDLCHPDDVQETKRRLGGVFSGEADHFEHTFRMRHAEGGWVWVLSSGRVVRRGPDGAPEAMSGIHIDISEQKAREQALRDARDELSRALNERDEAERRFSDIAEVSSDWFWEQDAELRFAYLSPGYERAVGGTDQMIGRRREESLGPNPVAEPGRGWDWLRERLDAREPYNDFVFRRTAPDGREVWLRISGAPIFDREGKFAGYRGVGSDVTALVAARERAEAGSRAKSEFLANMSHEIRTPLNGVLGMAELLATTTLQPKQLKMLATIRESGEALLTVINDILDLARIEAGKLRMEAIPFSPATLCDRIEALHAYEARKKGVALHVVRGPGAELMRLGDPQRLTQILHNLVGNAVKFTEAGEIELSVAAPAGAPLLIRVRDTGIGMSAEQQQRVFDEFEQGDGTITRRFGGTGLGLPIVRRLVGLLGGRLTLESAPGEGSTFVVEIDAPEALAETETHAAAAAAPDISGLRALAAEDNATNRLILQRMLATLGVEATVVADGAEAAAAWAPGRFDLVLLDIAMPAMDGVSALGAIKALAAEAGVPAPPAAAVTAHAMTHQLEAYRAAGFAACVSKPLRMDTLACAIARLAGRQAAAADLLTGPAA
ncbi:MAG: PAS domain S-box protein [Pikeienuella sp.]|uniref:PAS domain S-box protein n=1 Tax=Pikeienuella sp. TaxID=2831957 RepID=UPI0039189F45